MLFFLSLLIVYISWMRSGNSHGYQPPIIWLSVICLVCLVWKLIVARFFRKERQSAGAVVRHTPVNLLKDPLFAIAVLFISYLALQWYNAGRFLYFDPARSLWHFSEPINPYLPSAVSAKEAWEMLVWLVPCFLISLCIRHGLASRSGIRNLLMLLVVNSGLLGLFGLIQFFSDAKEVFWVWPQSTHFFASFSYQNHSGEFFLLMLCLSVGLLFRLLLFDKAARFRKLWIVILSLICLVDLLSVHFSLVAASTLFAWAVVAVAIVFAGVIIFKRFPRVMRLNLLVSVFIFASLVFCAMSGSAREKVFKEIGDKASRECLINDFDIRWWQDVTAYDMWKDHPWFGVGGWGYRHFLGFYMPQKAWILVKETGCANVHNDFMQFLVEFGALGFGLLLFAVVILFWPVFRYPLWGHPLILFPVLGVLMTCLHCLIDLPFRNTAILVVWTTMLTAAGEYARRTFAARKRPAGRSKSKCFVEATKHDARSGR